MSGQLETEHAARIDKSTVLPLSLFLGAVVMSVTAAFAWADLNNSLDVVIRTVQHQWTREDQINYALRTKMSNPGMRVVDPEDPSKELTINN